MLRIDPKTGSFWLEGIDEPLWPRMSYDDFTRHPARSVMPEVKRRRGVNTFMHRLPDGEFEGCRVWGTAEFYDGALESLWLQILAEKGHGEFGRFYRGDARILELQERWLREVVGAESSDDYPWGIVWNRFNINAGWHDIAVFFNKD